MNCLKCGKEITGHQTFCDSCLAVMSEYPIKPDYKVTLPHRVEAPIPKKQPRKRTVEEQLEISNRLIRWLIAALVTVTFLFILTASALVYTIQEGENLPTIGRNYTIDTTQQVQQTQQP